jgi:hypothetical protein
MSPISLTEMHAKSLVAVGGALEDGSEMGFGGEIASGSLAERLRRLRKWSRWFWPPGREGIEMGTSLSRKSSGRSGWEEERVGGGVGGERASAVGWTFDMVVTLGGLGGGEGRKISFNNNSRLRPTSKIATIRSSHPYISFCESARFVMAEVENILRRIRAESRDQKAKKLFRK